MIQDYVRGQEHLEKLEDLKIPSHFGGLPQATRYEGVHDSGDRSLLEVVYCINSIIL